MEITNKRSISISSLEEFLYNRIKEELGLNTFIIAMPQNIKFDEFAMVDTTSSLFNEGSHVEGEITIGIFCKPLSNGCKDINKMKRYEDGLLNIINNSNGDYSFSYSGVISTYNPDTNYYVNTIILQVKVS